MDTIEIYNAARQAVANGKMDEARDLFDMGLVKVATARCEGMEDKDLLDGVRIELWLERFWYGLENNNLLIEKGETIFG